MSKGTLAGKTAVITGSSRNIGKATALALAADGANIVVNGVQDQAAADAVVKEIEAMGGKAIAKLADVATKAGADALVQAGVDAFGGVDIMVVNASTRGQKAFLEMPHADFRRVVDTTIDSAFFLCQAAIPHMQKAGWGRVITLGGVSWYIGMPNRSRPSSASPTASPRNSRPRASPPTACRRGRRKPCARPRPAPATRATP